MHRGPHEGDCKACRQSAAGTLQAAQPHQNKQPAPTSTGLYDCRLCRFSISSGAMYTAVPRCVRMRVSCGRPQNLLN